MKKSELKSLLKPMIKECIKEVIFEEGILSNIVSEVAQGLGTPTLVESRHATSPNVDRAAEDSKLLEQSKLKARQQKEKLLSSINLDAYGGVDVFEGTVPLKKGGSASSEPAPGGPLGDVDPSDPGVDIAGIMGIAGGRWAAHMK
jgi:hypothetical protein